VSVGAISLTSKDRARETPLNLAVPPEMLEAVAERAAEIVLERSPASSWPEWMSVDTAARYLDVPVERVRKLKERRELPYYQDAPGCRVFFRRAELDAWMAGCRVSARPQCSNTVPRSRDAA